MNFSVFAWFLAMAVLFQLARGDMGLFPSLRSTPNGETFGDGLVPQIWFGTALVVLVYPGKVWSLVLLGVVGVIDLWRRLPVVSPSIYFHGLVSAQIVLTALYLCVRRRNIRITAAEFIDTFRVSILGLLVVLFTFAVFHKFTLRSPGWSAGFFCQLADYYLPILPMRRVPGSVLWLLTVGGESVILVMLFLRRTRWIALPLLVGFACFVGTLVYGFGSIVLASVTALLVNDLTFGRMRGWSAVAFMRRHATAQTWRMVFAAGIAVVFILDHWTGFTLADRSVLFPSGEGPTTMDVLTPMQCIWFTFSTTVLIVVIVAAYRHRSRIAVQPPRVRPWAAYLLPAYFILSEVGLYTGLKNTPNVAMFSGLRVASCHPNHLIVGDHLLCSFFYRDLLFMTTPEGNRIGIPVRSLQARWNRSRRLGIDDPLIEQYRGAKVTRLREGVEEPFDIERLSDVSAGNWIETLLPRRLFYLHEVSEKDLRCSMPDLFPDTGNTNEVTTKHVHDNIENDVEQGDP